jgi:hypothetical protein
MTDNLIQGCPFCPHEIPNGGSKKSVYELEEHILKNHKREAFDLYMKHNRDSVMTMVISNAIWHHGIFQRDYVREKRETIQR